MELIQRMDSPNFKLLFDVYHVQVMHGDVIRRLRAIHPWIGHYHTAGNPGRLEIDENQEINYPPIMRAILETGYKGFVAQEFIPTWEDPAKSLEHAKCHAKDAVEDTFGRVYVKRRHCAQRTRPREGRPKDANVFVSASTVFTQIRTKTASGARSQLVAQD